MVLGSCLFLCILTFSMLILIFVIIGVVYFLVKNIISNKRWRFYLINILVVIIYNCIGWWYIFHFLDTGGASLGPGLLLMLVTGIHFGVSILLALIKVIRKSVKEQSHIK